MRLPLHIRLMPKLILVRHSCPEIVSDVPANQWRLSNEGQHRCKPLADRLVAYQPDVLVASSEPKALETAQIVADLLGRSVSTAEGLHEHVRTNVGFLDLEQFEASVADFFENPKRLVLGRETADQAHDRFAGAIAGVVEKYPDENVAVFTHGTVMTLFVSRAAGLEPFPFWKRLGLPSFVVLSVPDLELLETVEHVEQERSAGTEPARASDTDH